MRPLLAYDEIFLSPHLDDAALSCGGQIAQATQRGAKVLIVSVFTADAPPLEISALAQELHVMWDAGGNPFKVRREEDEESCKILGADFEHWDFSDAIYRQEGNRWLYPSRKSLIAAPDAADEALLFELTRRLKIFSGLSVRGPLAVGGHVDHRLVRLAAEAAGLAGLELYEDFPYARSRKHRWLARGISLGWRSRVIQLTPEELETKIEAISSFESQLGAAFSSGHDLRAEIEGFAQARGGERLYSRQ